MKGGIMMSKGFGYEYSGTKGHIIGVASSLPKNPDSLLKNGWEDISHPDGKTNGHFLLKESSTGLKIGFDKGVPGESGFKGKDHYHMYNPDATGNRDLYLDKNGNPVRKGSSKSHILPEGDE